MEKKGKWIFENKQPMGGATGQAFINTLQGNQHPLDQLAREAIQNSCDAIEFESEKVRVVFRLRKLFRKSKSDFLDIMGVKEFLPRQYLLGLYTPNCFTQLEDPNIPLQLLYIEDYKTVGLFGNPHASKSNFSRLLLTLGDDTKLSAEGSTGGSYGYGKSVLSVNSRIHTIAAYSVFDPEKDFQGDHRRLMGCAYLDQHEFNGVEFTGRAWMGNARDERIVDPYREEEARAFAEKLGFSPRTADEHGTSILIVDCDIDMGELRRYIENSWWPRLCEDALDIQLYEDDCVLVPPRPRIRKDLQPFIECLDLATRRSLPIGKHQKADNFRKFNDVPLGSFGFQLIDNTEGNEEEGRDLFNKVALIRKPRMVVSYENVGRLDPPAVGVFLADDKIDHYLRLSESPAHDRWDPNTARLGRIEGARTYVKTVLVRLKQNFRRFQNDALPAPAPAEKRLRFLERELGSLFRPSRAKVSPTPPEITPVSIQFPKLEVVPKGEMLSTAATVNLALKEEYDQDKVMVNLLVKVPILEDDNVADGDLLPLTIDSDDFPTIETEGEARFPLVLQRDHSIRFSLETLPYDASWTTRVVVEVTRGPEA
jgi:hypothetical protein